MPMWSLDTTSQKSIGPAVVAVQLGDMAETQLMGQLGPGAAGPPHASVQLEVRPQGEMMLLRGEDDLGWGRTHPCTDLLPGQAEGRAF